MFEVLQEVPLEPIMGLVDLFRQDPRPDKIDLGIGVYKDAAGHVPILASVKEAETSVYQSETTKNYVGLAGCEPFNEAIMALVFGPDRNRDRLRAIQATGGQGAIRLLIDLIRAAAPDPTVWVSDPTWFNHVAMADYLHLRRRSYSYYDAGTGRVRFSNMIADLRQAQRGDVVILHGCCHNPTGADLSLDQWKEVAAVAQQTGFIPFVDFAYQGFGNGLDEDAAGIRWLAQQVPEMVVAVSCSKNFTVYRERVGCSILMARTAREADIARGQLMAIGRVNTSMSANLGAATVAEVLTQPRLRALWDSELRDIRKNLKDSRAELASALRLRTNSNRFDFIVGHNGMFSFLGLTPAEVAQLRAAFGIFMLDNSRINVAGITKPQAAKLAEAVAVVLGKPDRTRG